MRTRLLRRPHPADKPRELLTGNDGDVLAVGAQLRGKAMHAHRKDIPIVSGDEFARLVGQMESAE